MIRTLRKTRLHLELSHLNRHSCMCTTAQSGHSKF